MDMQAYKPFQQLTGDWGMTVRMWVKMFKMVFGLWLITLTVLLLLLFLTEMTAATFVAVLPFTLGIFGLYPLFVWGFHRYCKRKNYILRGPQIVTETKLVTILKSELAEVTEEAPFQLTPRVSIAASTVVQSFFICGCSGCGKTNFNNQLISHVRARRGKGVVLDIKEGEMLSLFHDPTQGDLVFNPFDQRSVPFNFFTEIKSVADYDLIAAACVPESPGKDSFWTNTARQVLSGCLEYLYQTNQRTMAELNRLLVAPIARLQEVLKQVNSPAAQYIEVATSGQAQGIMASLHVATNHIFRFLATEETGPSLSLGEWVNNGKPGFLWLVNNTKHAASLQQILTAFVTCLVNELLARPDTRDPRQRVYVILDEFAALHKIESLVNLLRLGRSKQISTWISTQEFSAIQHVYGKLATSLVNNCSSFLIGRLNSPDSCQFFSNLLGQRELAALEASYGTRVQHQNRDTGSIRDARRFDPAVMPGQISVLEDLNFYLRLAGKPISQIYIPYKTFTPQAERFVENPRFSSDYVPAPVAVEEPANGQAAAESGRRSQDSLEDDLRF